MSDKKKSVLANTFFDNFSFENVEDITEDDKIKSDDKTKGDEVKDNKEKEDVKDDASTEKKVEKTKEDDKTEDSTEGDKPKIEEYSKEEFDNLAIELGKKKTEDLKEDEVQFLADHKDDKLGEYVKKDDKAADAKDSGFVKLANDLITAGVIDDVEKLEDTQESFNEVIAISIDAKVEVKVDEYLADIPEDYKNVIDHFRGGGDVNEYLKSKATINYKDLDLKNVAVQRALVEAYLKEQEYSDDEITDKIRDYEDLEKLQKEATKASERFDKEQDKRIKAYDKNIIDSVKAQDKSDLEEVNKVKNLIDGMTEIAGFKLTPKRKKEFKAYLFDLDNQGETAATRAQNEDENRIKAHFMGYIGYNFADLEKAVTTKKTKSLSDILNRYSATATANKGTVVKDVDPDKKGEEKPFKFHSMFDQAPNE